MSKRGKKQNRARRAIHAPQINKPSEHRRLLGIFREQKAEGDRRGEIGPFQQWLTGLRGSAQMANPERRSVLVGQYGGFFPGDVLKALDEYEGVRVPPVDSDAPQEWLSTLESDDRRALVRKHLESLPGVRVEWGNFEEEWLELLVAELEHLDLEEFARVVAPFGAMNEDEPPVAIAITSLSPAEAAARLLAFACEGN